jgi:hypothetical protein
MEEKYIGSGDTVFLSKGSCWADMERGSFTGDFEGNVEIYKVMCGRRRWK